MDFWSFVFGIAVGYLGCQFTLSLASDLKNLFKRNRKNKEAIMSKKCIIYYGTVINEEGKGWAEKGSHLEEPIRVEEQETIGRAPEYCCEDFKKAKEDRILYFMSIYSGNEVAIYWESRLLLRLTPIHFCPFCGASIELKEDLKLKVVLEPRTVETYNVEKAD